MTGGNILARRVSVIEMGGRVETFVTIIQFRGQKLDSENSSIL
jgi:hypothetical protein